MSLHSFCDRDRPIYGRFYTFTNLSMQGRAGSRWVLPRIF